MSFFKKLKSKLFRSSSKIEEGLDAIVDNEEQVEDNISLNDKDITGQETEIGMDSEPEPEPNLATSNES